MGRRSRLPSESAVERHGCARDHGRLTQQPQRRRLVLPGGSVSEYNLGKLLGSGVNDRIVRQLGGRGRVVAENVLGIEGNGHAPEFRSDRIAKSTRAYAWPSWGRARRRARARGAPDRKLGLCPPAR